MIYVAQERSDLSVSVSTGGKRLGSQSLKPGYNHYVAPGLTAGKVRVDVVDRLDQKLLSSEGPNAVRCDCLDCEMDP